MHVVGTWRRPLNIALAILSMHNTNPTCQIMYSMAVQQPQKLEVIQNDSNLQHALVCMCPSPLRSAMSNAFGCKL
eukprot:3016275-Amphidinium_carterae.3